MTRTNKRNRDKQPSNPFHPGEILLEEFLHPGNVSQSAFASKLGWTRAKLNELIKGKRGITAETALDLAEALKTSPRLWMNLQATYDLAQASLKRDTGTVRLTKTKRMTVTAVKTETNRNPRLAAKVGRALERAGESARRTAKMYGTPIYVWENGKVEAKKP